MGMLKIADSAKEMYRKMFKEQELRSHASVSGDSWPNIPELEPRLTRAKLVASNSFEIETLTKGEIDFCRVAGYQVDLNDNKDAFVISWNEPAPNYCFR